MYTTTIKEDVWDQACEYIAQTYESSTYTLDHSQYQVTFRGLPMLEAFVAIYPQWLAV